MISLIAALVLGNVVTLDATTTTLELQTSSTAALEVVVSYLDKGSSAYTPGTQTTAISSATTTTILAAPAASTQRAVTTVRVSNVGTASNTVTLKHDASATERRLFRATLGPNEVLECNNDGACRALTASGSLKQQEAQYGYAGFPVSWTQKVGTASEAAAVRYSHAKDTGTPSAYVLGTPGLNGAVADCSTAAGAAILGAPLIPNPATGGLYATYLSPVATVAHSYELADVIWYNTGLVVTTTTAQAITPPTLPARDATGTNAGEGWYPAILVTAATTNVGAITNTTLSYTDSDGNAGNTATIASFPATAVIGTLVPFQLAAGDRGVQTIASVTLGTSYGGGSISLVLLREIARTPVTLANVGTVVLPPQNPGLRLYNGTCLWWSYISSATTATTTSANVWIQER